MTDDEYLSFVRAERARSIGFENDATLTSDRETALEYYQGEMDCAPVEGRSNAVSTDVMEAVDTALPDLCAIFEDEQWFEFEPSNESDIAAAAQETEALRVVLFRDNSGFELLSVAMRDALQMKTGVIMVQWADSPDPDAEVFEGTQQDVALAFLACQQNGSTLTHVAGSDADGLIRYSIAPPKADGRVELKAIPPEDFTVSPDTVRLRESPYCAYRCRERRDRLIADGFDADLVNELSGYSDIGDGIVARTRSEAGEQDHIEAGIKDRDLVEVIYHFIRIHDGGKETIWRVVTGNGETVLLSREQVNAIPFAALCPYPISHRFYGESLADRMLEIQRIKTAILRIMLDSGYYAMNQRVEVVETGRNEFTLTDLMDNRPGGYVRVSSPETIRPIQAGPLQFQPLPVLEYASVMGEQRSGVVRNAQGLNSDALHDTAAGMQTLVGAAQKRLRFMARLMAEAGLKDMLLLIHQCLRTNSTRARMMRLQGKFVPVDPTQWGERTDMQIEVGRGHEHDLAMLGQVLQQQQAAVQAGALQVGLLTPANLYASATKWAAKAGFKSPELFWNDPANVPPQPPKPNPEMAKVQVMAQDSQARALEAQQRLALDAQKLQIDSAHKDADRQLDAQVRMHDVTTRARADLMKTHMQIGQKADQTDKEMALKGAIASDQTAMQAAALHQADRHHVEDHIAAALGSAHEARVTVIGDSHRNALDHIASVHMASLAPKMITGGDVRPGGEPG